MPTHDNDNDIYLGRSALPVGQAHGQAALILVESLIHGLIDRSVLTTETSLEIVDAAVAVQTDYAAEADETASEMWRSLMLLSEVAESLRADTRLPASFSAGTMRAALAGMDTRSLELALDTMGLPDQADRVGR